MSTELYFNGVDGRTGQFATAPTTVEAVVTGLKRRGQRSREKGRGVMHGVDPAAIASAGWGVIFPRDSDPAIREALAPLIEWRREQVAAGGREGRFRVFEGEQGLLPGESKREFLARFGVGPGAVEPDKMPYYLLLAGDPAAIPYEFQYQLDTQHAVGRLAFDTPWDYAAYAASVIAAETGRVVRPRRAVFLGTRNPGDNATSLASEYLTAPLAAAVGGGEGGWSVEARIGAGQAEKSSFAAHLGGAETPAFLFTASHGLCYGPGDPCQRSFQGALLCQDWPGPGIRQGALPRGDFFTAADVAGDADVAGLVAMIFACYGAGTPLEDEFSRALEGRPKKIAEAPFVARLPQRLLAHPKGGALAVIGHVEQVWTHSFLWGSVAQISVFKSLAQSLLAGLPVGLAMEHFAVRLGEMGGELLAALDQQRRGNEVDPQELLSLWDAHHDARNYVVLGDPAVRLAPAAPDVC